MTISFGTNSFSPSVEETRTNTPIRSRTILERWPGAVAHTDGAEMNVTSIGQAKYFVAIIDDMPGPLHACLIKTKG